MCVVLLVSQVVLQSLCGSSVLTSRAVLLTEGDRERTDGTPVGLVYANSCGCVNVSRSCEDCNTIQGSTLGSTLTIKGSHKMAMKGHSCTLLIN